MTPIFDRFADSIATGVEFAAALLIAAGAIEAFIRCFAGYLNTASPRPKRRAWVHFASWLMLALEFELGADVIRTAISPTWNEIGQLGAIAAIRTFLNYFLERDIDAAEKTTASQIGV